MDAQRVVYERIRRAMGRGSCFALSLRAMKTAQNVMVATMKCPWTRDVTTSPLKVVIKHVSHDLTPLAEPNLLMRLSYENL